MFRSACRWLSLVAVALTLPTVLLTLATAGVAADPKKPDPLDWPMWRGPEGTGISREKNLPASWSPEDGGENLVWKSQKLGSRSSPIVLNGKLYAVCRNEPESPKEGEKVVCADINTGKILWENVHNIFLTDAPAERVGWASVVGDPATGRIYLLGLCGVCKCIDGESGKTVWERSLMEEYGILSTYGGRTNFPIVFEDLVIVSGVMTGWDEVAIPAHRFVAFNKSTGEAVWFLSTRVRPEDTTYSTPFVTVIDGQAAIVFGAGDGSIYAVQPRTGKIIWRFDASTRGINTPPIVVNGVVYAGHAEQNFDDTTTLGAVFAFKASGADDITKSNLLWRLPAREVGKSAPLVIDNRVYYIEDSAAMFILDTKSGKEVGKARLGRRMESSAVFGDGKIYVSEYGRFVILKLDKQKGVKIVSDVRLDHTELSGSPIISHGKVFIPTYEEMFCIGKADATPEADPIPPALKEADVKDDQKVAQVQITPVELLVKPGDKLPLAVRTFNAKGQLLSAEAKAKFTVVGAGSVTDDGVFETPAGTKHVAAKITAEVEGIKSPVARVRIVPPLPWSFDLSDKQVPITWIGARYRHQVNEKEGQPEPALVKITTIPKGTRSQSWMGHIDLHDYTIQADFKASIKNDKMPDMGLINQRYTLDLMGSQQKLQIRSWTARLELRFAKTLKFAWKPDTWYTLKFQSENKDDRVILRGKAWPKGEAEPKDWSIEAADLTPNRHGSPGLFGNSTNAEVFIDNISVTANK